jgi:hypothetical protein
MRACLNTAQATGGTDHNLKQFEQQLLRSINREVQNLHTLVGAHSFNLSWRLCLDGRLFAASLNRSIYDRATVLGSNCVR